MNDSRDDGGPASPNDPLGGRDDDAFLGADGRPPAAATAVVVAPRRHRVRRFLGW